MKKLPQIEDKKRILGRQLALQITRQQLAEVGGVNASWCVNMYDDIAV